jgi:hypothetical protein
LGKSLFVYVTSLLPGNYSLSDDPLPHCTAPGMLNAHLIKMPTSYWWSMSGDNERAAAITRMCMWSSLISLTQRLFTQKMRWKWREWIQFDAMWSTLKIIRDIISERVID